MPGTFMYAAITFHSLLTPVRYPASTSSADLLSVPVVNRTNTGIGPASGSRHMA